mgnify:CR=1 FL=1
MTTPTTTQLMIDVQATLANIFGCPNDKDQIDQLCAVSDWAANTQAELEMDNYNIQAGYDDHNDLAAWFAKGGDGENGLWTIPGIAEMIEWVEA